MGIWEIVMMDIYEIAIMAGVIVMALYIAERWA